MSTLPDDVVSAGSDQLLARMEGPIEQARGLPNEAFTSDAFFQLERQSLFRNTWVFAAPASEVPEPGDMKPVEVAGQPLILVRGNDCEVRVFHNVCPHRGARVLIEAGSGPALTCPYHAWSYELDGSLKGRPHYHGPGNHDRSDDGADRPCLFSVRSQIWYDWVFVNLSGQAIAFEEYMAAFVDQFEGRELSGFKRAHHARFEFDSNWKLIVENYCDFYHVFKVHPALHEIMTPEQRRAMQPQGAHLFNGYSFSKSGRGLAVDEEGPSLPTVEGLPANLEDSMVYGNMFPNVAINVYPSNLQFVLFEPLAPDRTVMHMWFYFVGDAATSEHCRKARDILYEEWASLNDEDEGVCRRLQQGRACDAYDGGRLAPYWDIGTLHFHRQVIDAINAQ